MYTGKVLDSKSTSTKQVVDFFNENFVSATNRIIMLSFVGESHTLVSLYIELKIAMRC